MNESKESSFSIEAFKASTFENEGEAWDTLVEDEGENSWMPRPDESGHFRLPILLGFEIALAKWRSGEAKTEDVRHAIDIVVEAVELRLQLIDESIQEGWDLEDDEVVQDIFEGFTLQMEALSGAIVLLESSPEEVSEEQADKVLKVFQEGIDLAMTGYVEFLQIQSQLSIIVCPRCQKENKQGSRTCVSCGFQFPGEATKLGEVLAIDGSLSSQEDLEETLGEGTIATPNFNEVEVAMQAWERQEIGDEDLRGTLAKVYQNFSQHHERLQRDRNSWSSLKGLGEEEREALSKIYESYEKAIFKSQHAISRMNEYFASGDTYSLASGIQDLWGATQLMVRTNLVAEQLAFMANKGSSNASS